METGILTKDVWSLKKITESIITVGLVLKDLKESKERLFVCVEIKYNVVKKSSFVLKRVTKTVVTISIFS